MQNLENLSFKVPRQVEELIGLPYSSFYHFVNVKGSKQQEATKLVAKSLFAMGSEFMLHYRINSDLLFKCCQTITQIYLEVIKNCVQHGSGEAVQQGIFLGEGGVAFGFRDFGEYFRREDVKLNWEENRPVPTTKTDLTRTCGNGNQMIYDIVDAIHVDTNEGVLYCFNKKENIFELIGVR